MDEPVSKILTNLEESETIRLDRWNLEVVPNEQAKGPDHAGKDNLPLNVMNNYFSLGVDAQIALEFHEARGKSRDIYIRHRSRSCFSFAETARLVRHFNHPFVSLQKNISVHFRLKCAVTTTRLFHKY